MTRRRGGGVYEALILVISMGCAGGSGPRGHASAPGEPTPSRIEEARSRVLSLTIEETIEAAEEVALLRGAAEAAPESQVPADVLALASRLSPRALPAPAARPGMTESFTFDGYRRGWLARLPAAHALLTPAYADGKIYLGGGFSSSAFFAYDARSGQPLWSVAAPAGGPSAAVIEDDKVVFNTESCTIYAIDAHTGRRVWERWLGDPLMSQPAVYDGMVYSGHVIDARSPGRIRPGSTGWGAGGGRRYGFTALRLRDGRPRWTRPIDADVMNAPVVDGGSIYFSTMDGDVYRLDRRNGRVRWHEEVGATSAPWLHEDEVHVTVGEREEASRERTLVLGQRRGEVLRHFDAVDAPFLAARADAGGVRGGWSYEGSRPTVRAGRMYQTIGNEVQARDMNGDLLWRRAYTEDASTRPASSPAVVGSQLIFGTREGHLYGLDVDTGLTAWAWDVGEPIAAQPTVAHGWVYASTTQGGVYGVEVADPTLDGWHMWGGSATHNGLTTGTTPPLEYTGRPSEGTMRLDDEPNLGELGGFPIQSTDVHVSVTGFVAHVRVQQTFGNPYERPVEGSYLFPVPEGAAVDGMEIRSGERVVRAEIQPVGARGDAGDSANERAVLVQERPDVFRQTVRDIPPSDAVQITLEYTQVLRYEDGAYHFAFPLRAGPRYRRAGAGEINPPGTPLEEELEATDPRPDTVRLTVDADLGAELSDVETPHHEVDVERRGRRAHISLAEQARPDRDFALRLAVGSERPEVAVVASPPEAGPGHFALALHPLSGPVADARAPREMVVVLDTSPSMEGLPMERARAALTRALTTLQDGDTLRVLTLDGRVATEVQPATRANVATAIRTLSAARTSPELASLDGLRAALDMSAPTERVRQLLLFTDGFIGSERDVFALVEPRLGATRFYAFGVGASVNRYLLTRLSERGNGAFEQVRLDETPEDAATRFVAHVARPQMTDLSIDWGELAVSDVYPRRVPDVFANRPVIVHGRFREGGEGVITIRGRLGGRRFVQRVEVALPEAGETHPELGSMWAQTRIRDLMTAMTLQPSPPLERQVTELALSHHILTPYTRFVAVDSAAERRERAVREVPPEETSPSTRPEQDTSGPVLACYEQARDEEGVVDPEALADCLAAL